MADISVTPKKSGVPTWLLALIAVVLVVALMIWLDMQEGTTAMTPVVEEDTAAAVVGDTTAVDTAAVDTASADTATAQP